MNKPICVYCTSVVSAVNTEHMSTCMTCRPSVDQLFWNYAFQSTLPPHLLKPSRVPLDNISGYYILPIIRYRNIFYTDVVYKRVTNTYAFDCSNVVELQWSRLHCIPLYKPRITDIKLIASTHAFTSEWLFDVLPEPMSMYEYVGGVFVL